MADAQLSSEHGIRSLLMQQHEEFRQLVSEHHALDERIHHLARVSHPADAEQLEEVALKKRKLALKDRIESIVRQHVATVVPQLRPQ